MIAGLVGLVLLIVLGLAGLTLLPHAIRGTRESWPVLRPAVKVGAEIVAVLLVITTLTLTAPIVWESVFDLTARVRAHFTHDGHTLYLVHPGGPTTPDGLFTPLTSSKLLGHYPNAAACLQAAGSLPPLSGSDFYFCEKELLSAADLTKMDKILGRPSPEVTP